MIEIIGTYNSAVCYTPQLESKAAAQIQAVCDCAAFAGSKIRIMPDVHAGKGCTIGTTMTITDKIVPGMVGVDIGCGMLTIRLAETSVDFRKLDEVIRTHIPCGRQVRKEAHPYAAMLEIRNLRCSPYVDLNRAYNSIGTLGGGNHFIEVNRGQDGTLYLVIHSGSRHLGTEVAEFYQDEGRRAFWGGSKKQLADTVQRLKMEGRFREIQPTLDALRREHPIHVPRDLAYVEGQLFEDYLHDMDIVQRFADWNRKAMAEEILRNAGLTCSESFVTVHNYIDTEQRILRKGAVAAYAGQRLLIPINMRDGSLICAGKGNPDWNFSAPHGAGRLMSRSEAFRSLSMEDYRKEMEGIFTTCVDRTTLDEAPMAYKSMEEIVSQITPTAEILDRIVPLYNFKAAD